MHWPIHYFSQVELKNKEQETMTEELLAKQVALNNTASELQQLRDMSAHQRKRIAEMLANFLKDLGEIGVAIGGDENLKVRILNVDIHRIRACKRIYLFNVQLCILQLYCQL